MKKKRTPQEKKRLSLEKDRRNVYGESPHAARSTIPKHKRYRIHAERAAQNAPLRTVRSTEDAERVERAVVAASEKRKTAWTKFPDEPLGQVIQRKTERRADSQKRAREKKRSRT